MRDLPPEFIFFRGGSLNIGHSSLWKSVATPALSWYPRLGILGIFIRRPSHPEGCHVWSVGCTFDPLQRENMSLKCLGADKTSIIIFRLNFCFRPRLFLLSFAGTQYCLTTPRRSLFLQTLTGQNSNSTDNLCVFCHQRREETHGKERSENSKGRQSINNQIVHWKEA